MFRLLAFHNGHRLDREFLLVGGDTYVLGRGNDANLHVTWDELISRRHVELHAEANNVLIKRSRRNRIRSLSMEKSYLQRRWCRVMRL